MGGKRRQEIYMRKECRAVGTDRKVGVNIISGALSGDGLSHRLVEGGGNEPAFSQAVGNKSTWGNWRRDGDTYR